MLQNIVTEITAIPKKSQLFQLQCVFRNVTMILWQQLDCYMIVIRIYQIITNLALIEYSSQYPTMFAVISKEMIKLSR